MTHPWWPPEGVSCPERRGLSSWSEPSLYSAGDSPWWPTKGAKGAYMTAKFLRQDDPPWWPTEGAEEAYMTAKFLCQDEPPMWPPEEVSCPESWRLPSWSQPSFCAKMTHLDDHLKEFLVLKVEDSLLADWESLLGELHGKLPGGNKETRILVSDLYACVFYFRLTILLNFERNIYTVHSSVQDSDPVIVVKWYPGSRSGSITLNYRTDPKILTFYQWLKENWIRKGQYFNFLVLIVLINTKCEKSNDLLPVWKHIF